LDFRWFLLLGFAATGKGLCAEFIKLLISRHLGYPVDRPEAVWRRYGGRRSVAQCAVWCWHARIDQIERGAALMIASPLTDCRRR
jgi:hypothetical protein